MNNRKTSFAVTVLFFLAFVAGLFFDTLQDIWFAIPFCLTAIGAGMVLMQGRFIPKSYTVLWIGLWGAYALLSVTWSSVLYNSMVFAGVFLLLPLIFMTGVIRGEDKTTYAIKIKPVFQAVYGVICFLAIWACVQYFMLFDVLGARADHPFSNANLLGGLLMMFLLPTIGYYLMAQGSKKTWAYALVAVLLIVAICATRSRGAMIAGLVILPFLLFYLRGQTHFLKRLGALLIGGVLGFAVVHFNPPPEAVLLTDHFGNTDNIQARLTIWQTVWDMIKQTPFLGTGLGTFYLHYASMRDPIDKSAGIFVHNDPLQFWAEMGMVAPVLFYAVMAAVVWRTVLALRQTADLDQRAGFLIPLSAIGVVAVQMYVTFDFYQPSFLIVMGLFLGLWFRQTQKVFDRAEGTETSPHLWTLTGWRELMGVVTVLLFLFMAQAGFGVYLTQQAQTELQAGKLENFIDKMDTAYQFASPLDPMPAYYYGEFYSSVLRGGGVLMPQDEQEMFRTGAFDMFDEAQRKNPYSLRPRFARAKLYLYLGDRKQAEEILHDILKRMPQHLNAREALADLYIARHQRGKALTILKEGLVWYYAQDPIPYYNRTKQMMEEMGQTSDLKDLQAKIDELEELKDATKKQIQRRHELFGGGMFAPLFF